MVGDIETMRRSKLEMHIDILKALALNGPVRITQISYGVNICSIILRRYLDFLIRQNLVNKHPIAKKRVAYAITDRGMAVLKRFRQLRVLLAMTEEACRTPT